MNGAFNVKTFLFFVSELTALPARVATRALAASHPLLCVSNPGDVDDGVPASACCVVGGAAEDNSLFFSRACGKP